jgi:hypothetical protein
MAEGGEIRTHDSLANAGYQNRFEGLGLSERITHPGSHGFTDATFDFIFVKRPNGVAAHNYPDECIGSLAGDAQFRFALTFDPATTPERRRRDVSNALY